MPNLGGTTVGGGTRRSAPTDKYKSGVAIPDPNRIAEMLAGGNWSDAYAAGHGMSPGASNEEIYNSILAPADIQNTFNRNYNPYRERTMNPYRRAGAEAANMFFANYGGMEGGPAMQSYIMQQAPFLDAMAQNEAAIMNMMNTDAEKALNARMNNARYMMETQHGLDRDRENRKAQQEAAEMQMWGAAADALGGTAASILTGGMM